MSLRAWIFVGAIVWAAVLFVISARAELPPGMHLANLVRVDTAYCPHRTPASAWLDSVVRVDSLNAKGKDHKR
jgi:hypothetical protein